MVAYPNPRFSFVLTGAAKRFGAHTALHRTNLAIARGQAVLLAGTNGAGKSTMLRMIAGLCQPTEGEVLISGRSLLHTPAARATIGFLSHHTLLYDELTVITNDGTLSFSAAWQRAQTRSKRTRAAEVFRRFSVFMTPAGEAKVRRRGEKTPTFGGRAAQKAEGEAKRRAVPLG